MKRIACSLLLVACGGAKPAPTPTTTGPDVAVGPQEKPAAIRPPEPPPGPVGHPSPDLAPRATLFGTPDGQRVQLPPGGKHLPGLAAKGGVINVYAPPADKPDQAKPITNETTRPIRQYFWAYDNKHVL